MLHSKVEMQNNLDEMYASQDEMYASQDDMYASQDEMYEHLRIYRWRYVVEQCVKLLPSSQTLLQS
jgi:hypothetical protein